MDLTHRQNLQNLLNQRDLRPQKRLGQNFLIDSSLPRVLATAVRAKPEDTVLEIGPGIGAITQALAVCARRVVAVEKDRAMVGILKETLASFKNIEVVQGDILRIPLSELHLPASYLLEGNLPFYLTAPVIRRFLETSEAKPRTMAFVVQKEVAQRICAKPPQMSILANAVQFYADPKIISLVPKKSFFPQPKVDAALITITPRRESRGDDKAFFQIVKAGFTHPRKQLLNNLAQGLKKKKEDVAVWLKKNNVSPEQRAETLSVEDWVRLTVNC